MSKRQLKTPVDEIVKAVLADIGSGDASDRCLEIGEGNRFQYENNGDGEILVEAWDDGSLVRVLRFQASLTLIKDITSF